MTYAEFTKRVIDELVEKFGVEVTETAVEKPNGVVKTGIAVKGKDTAIAPVIYLQEFYAELHERTFEEILKEIIDVVNDCHKQSTGVDAQLVTSKDYVENNVLPLLVNYSKNAVWLESVYYRKYLDLAVIYSVDTTNLGISGRYVIKSNLDFDESKLWLHALKNMLTSTWRCKITCMSELLSVFLPEAEHSLSLGDIEMYVITNQEKYLGDYALLDIELLNQLASQEDSDLYILPSSKHEIICLAAQSHCGRADELREMINCVNSTEVSNEDYLSDSLYYFDREMKEIRVV